MASYGQRSHIHCTQLNLHIHVQFSGDTASAWPSTTENTSNIPNKQSSKNLTKKQNAAQCMGKCTVFTYGNGYS